MKIRWAPSGRNAYWFQTIGEHEILHLGCFAVPLERSLGVYCELLARLYQANPSLWMEFQSYKSWWLNERRRDHKLSWKTPSYEDETVLAYDLTGEAEILHALKRFWLLKELRFYFWKQDGVPLQPGDIVAAVARNEFEHLTRYVPAITRFAAAREFCRSYLRIMFHSSEAKYFQQVFADFTAKSGLDFVLEASIFRQ